MRVCNKQKNQETKNAYEIRQNTTWNAEKFKNDYTIQFPPGFTGGVTGFEGNIFNKPNKKDSIYFSYSFCSPTFCYDFGDTLVDAMQTSIQGIFNFGKDTIPLTKRLNFTKKNHITGIYFYDKESFVRGKLFWKDGGVYKEALNVGYKKEWQVLAIESWELYRKNDKLGDYNLAYSLSITALSLLILILMAVVAYLPLIGQEIK